MAEIKLTRSGVDIGTDEYQSYILRVHAHDAVDMPNEIFCFQKNRIILNSTMQDDPDNDVFVAVADPADLQEYPITRPTPPSDQVYYRQDEVTILFRSVADMEETWQAIVGDVKGLVRAINSYNNLVPQEEVTVNG